MDGVRTWADGFGVWHCEVPRKLGTVKRRKMASQMITAELQERAPRGVKIEPVQVLLIDNNETTCVYAEYWED